MHLVRTRRSQCFIPSSKYRPFLRVPACCTATTKNTRDDTVDNWRYSLPLCAVLAFTPPEQCVRWPAGGHDPPVPHDGGVHPAGRRPVQQALQDTGCQQGPRDDYG